MKNQLRVSLLFSATMLLGCGGGSDSPAPPPPPPPPAPSAQYSGALVAGVASISYGPQDTEPGCIDGTAIGAKIYSSQFSLARAGDDRLVLPEVGICDGRTRIRSVDFSSNTVTTLAIGSNRVIGQTDALSTFLTPTSLAASATGDVYVADSDTFTGQIPGTERLVAGRGPGIWKIAVNGTTSPLAGVTLPGVGLTGNGVDGQGAAASFGYLGVMCAGSDGLLYVTDNRQVRTVDTNGVVGTIVTPDANQQRVLACGPDGSVLMRRWFLNPAENDYYDPIARKSIAKVSAITTDIFSVLAYFGTSNPKVLVESGSASRSVDLINLTDGTSTTVVKLGSPANPLGSPPVIDETSLRAGTAINAKDFSLLSIHAIYKFAQK